jgi:hypothetical protein
MVAPKYCCSPKGTYYGFQTPSIRATDDNDTRITGTLRLLATCYRG